MLVLGIMTKGALAPYGCHPSESTRLSGHGWRFPPPSVNYRDSMPFRPRFEDAIPVTNRGMHPLCSTKFYHEAFFIYFVCILEYHLEILRFKIVVSGPSFWQPR